MESNLRTGRGGPEEGKMRTWITTHEARAQERVLDVNTSEDAAVDAAEGADEELARLVAEAGGWADPDSPWDVEADGTHHASLMDGSQLVVTPWGDPDPVPPREWDVLYRITTNGSGLVRAETGGGDVLDTQELDDERSTGQVFQRLTRAIADHAARGF